MLFALDPYPEDGDLFAPVEEERLFQDLQLVCKIDKQLKETLPFFYNYAMVGGYFHYAFSPHGTGGQ